MNYSIGDFLTLLGSLALFLYGMKVMSDALMDVAGDKMRNILASMTSNRVFAVFTGFLITAVIQSSSATTLMVVSFVNASLLTLFEAIGVILGAHIGTTITAWLITILGFKVSMSSIALPLVALGFLFTFSKKNKTQSWGKFIIGFAVLFIGMQFLKDSVPDVNENPEILSFLKNYTDLGFGSVLLFLGIGTLLTLIIQSSSATMALTLVMCYEGWLPFDMAAAMVLGENIGTTITANLGALVANYKAKRAARAHFISNTLGVLWMLILLYPTLHGIEWFLGRNGGASPFESAIAIPVALSIFHTSFNIANTFVLIWLIPIIVKMVKWMVPEKEDLEVAIDQPKYLSDNALTYPQTAIRALFDESKRMYEKSVYKVISHSLNVHRDDLESKKKIKKIVKKAEEIEIDIDDFYYQKMKTIYSKIITYSTKILSKFSLATEHVESVRRINVANRYMVEVIKNMKSLHKNISKYSQSDNPHIKKEYRRLQTIILKVIREINTIESSKEPEKRLKKLEKLRMKAIKSDVLMSGYLEELVRENNISDEMATSLINDNANAILACRRLVSIAELLYIKRDTIIEEFSDLVDNEETLINGDGV